MWRTQLERLHSKRVRKYKILDNEEPVTFAQVAEVWQGDEAFHGLFLEMLRQAPFEAYRWETPAVTAATWNQPFEFVLVNDPALARLTADSTAFADQLAEQPSDQSVVTFPNLGGDALLVVPRPVGPPSSYTHLAAFVRAAPEAQQHALWRAVGAALEQHVGASPCWLSTAGLGVPWLHARLDARPKYYCHEPYRRAPG